jgi:ATP-binding cassette subfamily F protein 3
MSLTCEEIEKILKENMPNFEDEDILSYMIAVIEGMDEDERKSSHTLNETISPFLLDVGYVDNDEDAEKICKKISVCFGGSGYKSSSKTNIDEFVPVLMAAPIKMIDNSGLVPKIATFGSAFVGASLSEMALSDNLPAPPSLLQGQASISNTNTNLNASAIHTTQKQVRKAKKENEILQKVLRHEAAVRAAEAEEMSQNRMKAILASRNINRQAGNGVSIDRFSVVHPSGTGDLLTDISLTLAPSHRYGLVGRNGAGKSTLMRLLANYKIEGLMHLKILLVDQHVEGDNETPLQWLYRADVERSSLIEDETRLTYFLHGNENNDPLPDDLNGVNLEMALTECYERMQAIGCDTAELRANKILLGLGFDLDMISKPTSSLSGGWCMRAALAAAIFVKPNLLLLDEPTNHLDLHALVWLQNWLTTTFEGIAIIVSHDRYFLDSVCTDVLELRSKLAGQSKSCLDHYAGDYETYEHTVAERKVVQARARDAYEREKEKLREFIARDGKKYDNPAHQSQRKMKIKQLASLVEIESVEEDSELVMHLPSPYGVFDSNEKVIGVSSASFSYEDKLDKPLFENVDFSVKPRDRLCIMGKNGCGKTSLLNILIGEATPTKGAVTRHVGVRITMLQQHHYKGEQLDPNLTPLEHLRRLPQSASTAVGLHDLGTRQEETAHRGYLSNFGMQGHRAMLPVKYLSGGQRMRVALAIALFKRPDLLILDEPTNHLDADTVNALCVALEGYDGAIIAVSHDEAFVNRVIASKHIPDMKSKNDIDSVLGGELLVMENQKLKRFDGSFQAYKKQIMKKVLTGANL